MISWCGSWRANKAAALSTDNGLSSVGLGTPSAFGIHRHQCGKDWTSPVNSPEQPHGCGAARDSCGISKNTDFRSYHFCSFQLSPAFKFTYIKRKLNCPLQQKSKPQQSKHPPANCSLESIKNCQVNVPVPAAHPGLPAAQGTLWALLSATSCAKNHHRAEIFHIPTRVHMPTINNHIPSQLELCEGKETPPGIINVWRALCSTWGWWNFGHNSAEKQSRSWWTQGYRKNQPGICFKRWADQKK